jgi:hypothetical protein
MQPVIYLDENGERRIEMMRWGFQLPDRLQFLARSETVDRGVLERVVSQAALYLPR